MKKVKRLPAGDSPPLTDNMLRRMRPAREVAPDIVAAYEASRQHRRPARSAIAPALVRATRSTQKAASKSAAKRI